MRRDLGSQLLIPSPRREGIPHDITTFEYEQSARSEFVPELDLALLVAKASMSDQYDAVNEFVQAICNIQISG